jgi:hypothetical protein
VGQAVIAGRYRRRAATPAEQVKSEKVKKSKYCGSNCGDRDADSARKANQKGAICNGATSYEAAHPERCSSQSRIDTVVPRVPP